MLNHVGAAAAGSSASKTILDGHEVPKKADVSDKTKQHGKRQRFLAMLERRDAASSAAAVLHGHGVTKQANIRQSRGQRFLGMVKRGSAAVRKGGSAVKKGGIELARRIFRTGASLQRRATNMMGRGAPDERELAARRARSLNVAHFIKDLHFAAHGEARAGIARADFYMHKTIQARAAELRALRLAEERRQAALRARRALLEKVGGRLAAELWGSVFAHAMTYGAALIVAQRMRAWLLRQRARRVLAAFERQARRLLVRKRAAVLARVALRNFVLPAVFDSHDRRRDASLDVQCAYRVLVARRRMLQQYIAAEAEVLAEGKLEVFLRWQARVSRAVRFFARVETEAMRQRRRRVWARTDFSRSIAKEHYRALAELRAKRDVDPPSVTANRRPYDGKVALKLPNANATAVVAAVGSTDSRLHWLGVPVGATRLPRDKRRPNHQYALEYAPVPTQTLGLSLLQDRDRREAQIALEHLREEANQPQDQPQASDSATPNWYDEERALLWSDTSSLLA